MEENRPLFSIIIPTYDRPLRLESCLQSLTRLHYPRDRFEVIVVDDGSNTPPEAVVNVFSDQLDTKPFTQTNAGPSSARNSGISLAKGEFSAFIDNAWTSHKNHFQRLSLYLMLRLSLLDQSGESIVLCYRTARSIYRWFVPMIGRYYLKRMIDDGLPARFRLPLLFLLTKSLSQEDQLIVSRIESVRSKMEIGR